MRQNDSTQLMTDTSLPYFSLSVIFTLSFHSNDSLAAARRLANYWKQRKEIFKERAFLPIDLSGNGGLTLEDVQHLRTGFCVNLPPDEQGRSVLYVDVSKHGPDITPSLRTIFFFSQCVMENETSRQHGFHTFFNISNPFAANYLSLNAKCHRFLMDHCIPIIYQRLYFVYMPPPGASISQSFLDTSKCLLLFMLLLLHSELFIKICSCRNLFQRVALTNLVEKNVILLYYMLL